MLSRGTTRRWTTWSARCAGRGVGVWRHQGARRLPRARWRGGRRGEGPGWGRRAVVRPSEAGPVDSGSCMRATAQPLEDNKVKLSVEVDEAEFERALNDAFRKMAREVKVPGFRPGKVPRRLLEARLGPGVLRQEAFR